MEKMISEIKARKAYFAAGFLLLLAMAFVGYGLMITLYKYKTLIEAMQ